MAKSLIKTYGLRWHASRVQWSGRNKDVGLWGVPAKQRRSKPTNFADQIAIYVLYDGEIPIYVGQSGAGNNRLMGRLKHHRADRLADRWDRFSWFGLCRVQANGVIDPQATIEQMRTPEILNQIEAVIVEAVEPRLNRQGGQFGDRVVRYVQYPDARSELSDGTMLKEVHEAVVTGNQ